ncbi:hypothetical protein FOZ62_023334 [Perkinsus olseni]|uniref:Reverse transcriptase domain-containing protein n=1 Tax=Perkinsus olseni TaxID=32597 RepID=A0A7J6Q781_PEROL|nr:hypothetical protein FOZ62_023334 [Perkinsus olseni]
MDGCSAPGQKSGKRTAEAAVRRNSEKRARQRDSWREAEEVRSCLSSLETKAQDLRREWERSQVEGLTDGTAGPGFCPWSIQYGPRTRVQSALIDVLEDKIEDFAETNSGKFVRRWSVLPRGEQGGFDWTGVERDVDELADQLRTEWCAIIKVDGRTARSGSPLRPLLLKELALIFNPNFPEDWNVIDQIDQGYKAKDVPGHPVSLLERETFWSYRSAESDEGREIVTRCLEEEVRKGYLRKEPDPNQLPEDAIVSKVALLEKPGRIPRAYRMICDLRRSGVNDLIKGSGNLEDTASLPGLRAVSLVVSQAVEKFKVSSRFIELDASEAFRHISVHVRDRVYLYLSAVDDKGERQLYRNLRIPFGLVSSPIWWIRTYSMCYRLLRAILRILCTLYVDDGVFESAAHRCFDDFISLILVSRVVGVRSELAKARISDSVDMKVEIPEDKITLVCQQGDLLLHEAAKKEKTFTRYRCHLSDIYSWCHKVKSEHERCAGAVCVPRRESGEQGDSRIREARLD